jgi:hypothetical protein
MGQVLCHETWQIILVLLVAPGAPRCRLIAALVGIGAIAIAVAGNILRIRWAQNEDLSGSAPLNPHGMFRDRVPGACAIAASRYPQFIQVLTRHLRQKAHYAC